VPSRSGFLGPGAAAALLTHYQDFPAGPFASASSMFMTKVRVSSDGSVQSVSCPQARASASLCDAVVSTITAWRFRSPAGSRTEPFWTSIPIFVAADGSVTSGLSPGGHWQ
jgi:hypothetical protein